MDIKLQQGDQVGATPLSWSSKDSVEQALQEAKRSAYAPFKPNVEAAQAYAAQRAQQAHGMVSQPWHSQAGVGTASNEATGLMQMGAGWTGKFGQELEKLFGPEWMKRIAEAPGKVSVRPDMAHPVLKPIARNAYGVTVPDAYLANPQNSLLRGQTAPMDATIALGPHAFRQGLQAQTAAHEGVGHAIGMAETGRIQTFSPEQAKQMFIQEYLSPSALHAPEYLTKLQQFYNAQDRGGISHAAADLMGNKLASQGGFNVLDRSVGTGFPILNTPMHERILNEIKQTGSYR